MRNILKGLVLASLACLWATAQGADVVPNEVQMPGTQPNDVGNFESPDKCDNCHSGYNDLDPGAEPATGWRGGAMGNAGRDPVFWATLAVAEQDFDGAGDLCIRCHSAKGWYGGRSTPTDGSGLASSDDNGIDCDTCHASTNTDNSGINPDTDAPLQGVMISPFIANCSDDDVASNSCESTTEGYYGSGMLSLFESVNVKLGPYRDAEARHQWEQSAWHRHPDFCGTCHDVSNPVVGDLAPNHGTQVGAPAVIAEGSLDAPGDPSPNPAKAAFNNPPYAYGIVERTFSEYKSSPLSSTLVAEFNTLPTDLKTTGGSLDVTYQAAIQAGTGGNYADGTDRYFSCQSCHMRPVGVNPDTGEAYPGCNKNGAPLRADLPRHDHTGGNYWFASMAKHQDDAGTLRVGGGLNSTQLLAMDLGQERATKHLSEAAALSVTGNSVTVTNLTGHKLITGYPEGRRMWLRIEWHDDQGDVIRVDGDYGTLQTNMDLDGDGQADAVETIIDLDGTNTEIYEAHYAITKDWAATIEALHGPDFVLSFDRVTGDVLCTVSDFRTNAKPECTGDHHDTFHFALNNYVSSDNRIPPYQMNVAEARKRNALPVPENRYAVTDGAYEHADTVALSPPPNAVHADIQLLYQGTSWEYMQFLMLANNGTNAFLGDQGDAMMDAWLNASVKKSNGDVITGVMDVDGSGEYKMVPPVVMASVEWGQPPQCNPTPGQETGETSCQDGVDNDCDGLTDNADPDCAGCIPTGGPDNNCDGVDDDCDGTPDDEYAVTPTSCGTGVCDASGQLVCQDGTEVNTCSPGNPTEDPEVTCDDGQDNDCDGLTDASDPSCGGGMACGDYSSRRDCNNAPEGCKWDKNTSTCVDANPPVCEPTETPEVTCTGGVDEDCDGAVDCADSDCSGDPACQTTCNNDGICDPGENCNTCASDCAGVTGGKPANRYCCGNDVAESAEGDGSICDGNF